MPKLNELKTVACWIVKESMIKAIVTIALIEFGLRLFEEVAVIRG